MRMKEPGSETSGTSQQITGCEPEIPQKKPPQSTLPTTLPIHLFVIAAFIYSIFPLISEAARAHYEQLLFTPIPHATRHRLTPSPKKKNMMSMFKTQPQHRLNSVNYMFWKKPRPYRTGKSRSIRDIATGAETYPQTGGRASAIQTKQRDHRTRAATRLDVVQAACTPDAATHISRLHDLCGVWEALRPRSHTKEPAEARLMIGTSFDRCTLKDDEKLIDYFTRLSEIQQQLFGSPAEINDLTFLYHIFGTLRQVPKFQMTVGHLQNGMRAGGLTPDAAMNRIEAAEQMHDEDTNIGDTSTAAEILYASGRRGRGSDRGHGRGGRGWGQGRGSGGSSNRKENDDGICYHCGLKGHIKADCRPRARGEEALAQRGKRNVRGNGPNPTRQERGA